MRTPLSSLRCFRCVALLITCSRIFLGKARSLEESSINVRFATHFEFLDTQLLGEVWRIAVDAITTVVIITVTLLQTQLPVSEFYVMDTDITVHHYTYYF
jgi:hypothetical protein